MAKSSASLEDQLTQLITVALDCENALRTAASLANQEQSRKLLAQHARRWRMAGAEIRSLARAEGLTIKTEPSTQAVLRRAWIKVKSSVDDEAAISAECRAREAAALEQFEKVCRIRRAGPLLPALRALCARLGDHSAFE